MALCTRPNAFVRALALVQAMHAKPSQDPDLLVFVVCQAARQRSWQFSKLDSAKCTGCLVATVWFRTGLTVIPIMLCNRTAFTSRAVCARQAAGSSYIKAPRLPTAAAAVAKQQQADCAGETACAWQQQGICTWLPQLRRQTHCPQHLSFSVNWICHQQIFQVLLNQC